MVGGNRGNWRGVWAVRPDDAGDWRVQRSLAADSPGTRRGGAGVSRAGRGWRRDGLADADPLGAVRPGAAWVAATDRSAAGSCGCGGSKNVGAGAGAADRRGPRGRGAIGLVAPRREA